MCTVSLVPAGERLRVMCNRDERHTRPAALPPVVTRSGGQLALLPLDPLGGGTWIAANAAGLVFAVLNGAAAFGAPGLSRGRLILELLDAVSLDDALGRARALCRRDWPAHRLLAADRTSVLDLRVGLAGLGLRRQALAGPLMFTSSSLGDDLVAAPRQELFQRLVVEGPDPIDGQDAFHRHRWHDRPHLSVHMRRHDAATQSITTVDVSAAAVRMCYESTTDLVGMPAMLSIARRPALAGPALDAVETVCPASTLPSLAVAS
jgi:hypothetical protein